MRYFFTSVMFWRPRMSAPHSTGVTEWICDHCTSALRDWSVHRDALSAHSSPSKVLVARPLYISSTGPAQRSSNSKRVAVVVCSSASFCGGGGLLRAMGGGNGGGSCGAGRWRLPCHLSLVITGLPRRRARLGADE